MTIVGILVRMPTIDATIIDKFVQMAKERGFYTEQLFFVAQK